MVRAEGFCLDSLKGSISPLHGMLLGFSMVSMAVGLKLYLRGSTPYFL